MSSRRLKVRVGEREYEAEVRSLGGGRYIVVVEGRQFEVSISEEGSTTVSQERRSGVGAGEKSRTELKTVQQATQVPTPQPIPTISRPRAAGGAITAPISGRVRK
ncbi:MAG: hypothetical protein DRO12_03705, partial [Thermoprotei archaeon]